jgi:zinc transport system permease protein
MNMLTTLVDGSCDRLAALLNTNSFIVRGTVALILVSLVCGAVGSQVVGNRMAFFSDALAHSAFAGISLALVTLLLSGVSDKDPMFEWFVPLFMAGFGTAVGIGIALVREKTALASDTVIGVFFAGALGIGVLTLGNMKLFTNMNPEVFLFGSTNSVRPVHIVLLLALALVTAIVLTWRYNQMVFASFNPSLARSRRIPVRLNNYLFIVLLALIVNICLQVVGVILINAMLLVPAATASLLSRNMRQMFWWTTSLSLFIGLLGQWVSLTVSPVTTHGTINLGASGCVILLNVLAFAVAMGVGPLIRGRQAKTL